MDNYKVRLRKNSFNSDEFKKVVDTEFKTFVKPVEIVDTDTVEELFRLYDKLYYTIPVEGENNSHQYILKRSSELRYLPMVYLDLVKSKVKILH